MKKCLSLVSAAVLATFYMSNALATETTFEGNQNLTSQVWPNSGETYTYIDADSVVIDISANTSQGAPAFVANGSTINFGTNESKLGTVTVKANDNTETDVYWTGYVKNGTVNINADKYEQTGSGHGIYVIGANGVSSVLNINVDVFESTTFYTALHARQGEGAIINVGSEANPLTSFYAKRTVEDSGVSLLQANEGSTINVFSDKIKLDAFNTKVGGGALGSGAWGTINLTGNVIEINGSINGDYGGTGASHEGDVFAVNINAGLLNLTGDIYAGSNGSALNGADSKAYNRQEKFQITATDPSSTITGNIEAYNKSSTVINFVNGGSFTGDITTSNYSDTSKSPTTSSIELAGAMNYKGSVSLVGESSLNLSGNITASESDITSADASTVTVGAKSDFKTVTSTSSGGVTIAQAAELKVNDGQSSISVLNNDGTLYVANSATATIQSLSGDAAIKVDSDKNTVSIASLAAESSVEAIGSSTFNDNYEDSATALTELLNTILITEEGAQVSTLTLDQGTISDGASASVNEQGQIVNVRTTKNANVDALGSISALGLMQWRHEMNDLTKRLGELRDSAQGVGAWARLYGSEQEYGAQSVTAKSTSIQVGADLDVGSGWKVGAAFVYTDGDAKYSAGDADYDSYGLALYGTWLGQNGLFVDLIGKYSRLDSDFNAGALTGGYDNNAYSLSAEVGWHFKINDLFFVEPQAEFTWGHVTGDKFSAGSGVTVEQDDYDSLIGRIGVRTGFYFPDNKGTIYARVSGLYDFDGETNASVTRGNARNTIDDDLGGAWVEFGVGANFNWTENTYTYVDLEKNAGGEVKENWRFNVGVRHVF